MNKRVGNLACRKPSSFKCRLPSVKTFDFTNWGMPVLLIFGWLFTRTPLEQGLAAWLRALET